MSEDGEWGGEERPDAEPEARRSRPAEDTREHREQETGAEAAAAASGTSPETALSFRQAMEELEGILQRIEGEEIDIDQLAQELRRAAQLLDICRGKIRKAEVEVTQIVQHLEASAQDEDRDRS